MRIVVDRSTAEDIVQEVVLELWKKKNSFDKDFNVLAYLNRSVYNRSINHVRSKAANFDSDEILYKFEGNDTPIEQLIEGDELMSRMKGIINELPDRCRAVFALSRYEEKSYKEISDDLGISIKTVENQIGKALKLLRQKMSVAVNLLLLLFTIGG